MLIRHIKIIETFNTLKNMQKTSSHRLTTALKKANKLENNIVTIKI